jgi:cyclopropane fatty-acyl-phospholipid synthase-like methyltransferase
VIVLRELRRFAGGIRRGVIDTFRSEEERLEAMVGRPGLWQVTRSWQFDFLRQRGLEPGQRLLEMGCGPLRGGIPLIRYLDHAHYTGIDINPKSVAVAWRQIEREGLIQRAPRVVYSDSFGRRELEGQRFDVIWAFQVLYHLEDKIASECIEQARALLEPDGLMLANVNTTNDESRWKDLPYVKRPLEFYEQLAQRNGLTVRSLGKMSEFGYTQATGKLNDMLEFRIA